MNTIPESNDLNNQKPKLSNLNDEGIKKDLVENIDYSQILRNFLTKNWYDFYVEFYEKNHGKFDYQGRVTETITKHYDPSIIFNNLDQFPWFPPELAFKISELYNKNTFIIENIDKFIWIDKTALVRFMITKPQAWFIILRNIEKFKEVDLDLIIELMFDNDQGYDVIAEKNYLPYLSPHTLKLIEDYKIEEEKEESERKMNEFIRNLQKETRTRDN